MAVAPLHAAVCASCTDWPTIHPTHLRLLGAGLAWGGCIVTTDEPDEIRGLHGLTRSPAFVVTGVVVLGGHLKVDMRATPTRIGGIASYSPQRRSPTVDPGSLCNGGVNVSIRRSTNPRTVVVEGNGHSIATMLEILVSAGWPNSFHLGADW